MPSLYLLNPLCVDKGEYIDHGSFGDIYHGAVYPSVTATVREASIECLSVCEWVFTLFYQDDEGRQVAIKIDRLDSKKFSAETATKSYVEVSPKDPDTDWSHRPRVAKPEKVHCHSFSWSLLCSVELKSPSCIGCTILM